MKVFNFINVICTAFTLADPESVKIQLSHLYLFTLLGSPSEKAARRNVDEIETRAQLHQRSTFSFYTRRFKCAKKTVKSAVSFCTFGTYEHKICT